MGIVNFQTDDTRKILLKIRHCKIVGYDKIRPRVLKVKKK